MLTEASTKININRILDLDKAGKPDTCVLVAAILLVRFVRAGGGAYAADDERPG